MPTAVTRQTYNVPGLLAAESYGTTGLAEITQVKTSALLFYEGEHTSMAGSTKRWTRKTLETIAAKTQAHLTAGNRIKLYLAPQDHAINQAAAVGLVSNVRLAEITDSTLPMPGQVDLIGKLGLYADVEILDEGAIQQYQKGLLKELSIGLGRDSVIYEVSGVSIPALSGAALFALPEKGAYEFALTMSEQEREESQQRELFPLIDRFLTVIASIRDASPEELAGRDPQALREQAITDLASQLRTRLGLDISSAQAPLPIVPAFSKEPEMSDAENTPTVSLEQFTALQTELETLRSQQAERDQQLALFARKTKLDARFAGLRQQAEVLRNSGRLTPAEFNDLFSSASPDLEQFSKPAEGDAELTKFEGLLGNLEFYLGRLEKTAKPVQFGLPTEGAPLDTDNAEQFAKEFCDRKLPKIAYR